MSRPARLFDGALQPGRRHAGMGIAAHSATRHFELGPQGPKGPNERWQHFCRWEKAKRMSPWAASRVCDQTMSILCLPTPPPRSPACSLRTHSDLDWAFTKATRAALSCHRACLSVQLRELQPHSSDFRAYRSRTSSSSSSPTCWKPAILFCMWFTASCVRTTTAL
jgi:hypothetical protein